MRPNKAAIQADADKANRMYHDAARERDELKKIVRVFLTAYQSSKQVASPAEAAMLLLAAYPTALDKG